MKTFLQSTAALLTLAIVLTLFWPFAILGGLLMEQDKHRNRNL